MTVKEFIGTLESSDRLRIIEGKAEVYVGYRRAGRQLFTRRTGTAYSIGESKRGIPYNRRTQT